MRLSPLYPDTLMLGMEIRLKVISITKRTQITQTLLYYQFIALSRHYIPTYRSGVQLRQGQDNGAAIPTLRGVVDVDYERLRERGVHSHKRHALPAKLLRRRPTAKDVFPLPGSALQNLQTQVADHHAPTAGRLRLRLTRRGSQ